MNSEFLSLLNVGPLQESRYKLIDSQGPFEIRFYQQMLCAKLSLSGSYGEVLKEGLRHLNEFIGGNNFKVHKIEKHGPVFHIHTPEHWEIGIILPSSMSAVSAPRPINRLIKIEEISPGRVGVLRFHGKDDQQLFFKRSEELKKWLVHKGLKHDGPFIITRPPGQLINIPFLRQNEVHLNVY
jgi:hypothetical protein